MQKHPMTWSVWNVVSHSLLNLMLCVILKKNIRWRIEILYVHTKDAIGDLKEIRIWRDIWRAMSKRKSLNAHIVRDFSIYRVF